MFEIGFPELVVISIIALLVLGPERLPEALRTMGLWFGRMRRSFTSVKNEIEKEIGMDDIRRQLHNEAIMEEMQRIEAEVNSSMDTEVVDDHGTGDGNSIAPPATSTTIGDETPPSADPGTADADPDGAEFANEPLTDPNTDAQENNTSAPAATPLEKANRADNA